MIREVLAKPLTDAWVYRFYRPSCQSGLERLRTHLTGWVVLLDLMRPQMGGYVLLQAVAAEDPLATRHALILKPAMVKTLLLRAANFRCFRTFGLKVSTSDWASDANCSRCPSFLSICHQGLRQIPGIDSYPHHRFRHELGDPLCGSIACLDSSPLLRTLWQTHLLLADCVRAG